MLMLNDIICAEVKAYTLPERNLHIAKAYTTRNIHIEAVLVVPAFDLLCKDVTQVVLYLLGIGCALVDEAVIGTKLEELPRLIAYTYRSNKLIDLTEGILQAYLLAHLYAEIFKNRDLYRST